MANGEAEGVFEEELRGVVREEMEAVMGSRTKTPWSPQSFDPQGEFGVTVPKTFDEIYVQTGTLSGVVAASDPTSAVYASRRQPSDVPNFYSLPTNERRLFDVAAKAVHPMKTGENYYQELIEASWDLSTKGIYRSPQQLAYEGYLESPQGGGAAGASGSGSSSGYTGPRETITMASERDLRTAVDAMASQVLGRAATEDEFKNALAQVRTAEQAEPTITTTGVGRTVTQSGLTAEGRSDIIREALMQGPEAEDFGKATKMMDLFYSALEARPSGA